MYQNMQSGQGMLKTAYKGPISQMNDAHPMINAIRRRRDIVGQTQSMGK